MANNPSANASRPPFVVRSNEVPVGAEAPFTALFLADTHLTLCDAHDNGRKNALAAARLQGEFRDAKRNLDEALVYARATGIDFMLHAGDLIDFTSAANFDAAAALFAKHDFFICAGNHEFSQYVGEAEEDEAYKAQSFAAVQGVYPNDLVFASRIVHGVNFVAVDNTYYRFTESQLARMEREVAKGLPIVLLCHVPLYTPGLYDAIMARTSGVCSYQSGVPDALVDTWRKERDWPEAERWRDRRVQQRADAPTLEFLDYLKAQPLLKVILCGHTHFFWEERFSPTAVQIVCPGTYTGEALGLRFA